MLHRIHTLCFEVPEDGADLATGGADSEVTDAPVEPAAEATPAPEAPAGFDFNSPVFQQAVQQYASQATEQQIQAMIAQHEAEQAQQFELPEFDPTNPEGFGEGLLGAFDQRLQSALAPITAALEQQQIGEASTLADQMAAGLPEVASIGELLPEDKRDGVAQTIRGLAEGFLPTASAQYGEGPRAVQAAMQASAAHLQGLFSAAHEAGKQAYIAEMKGVTDAARTPQAGTDGVQTARPARDEEEFALNWARQNGAN